MKKKQKFFLNIIIVSYNTADLTLQTVKSVLNQIKNIKQKIAITVVDNNSKDDTLKRLEKYKDKIFIIKNKQNLGFAKANNIGVKVIDAEFYMLLNSDTIVLDKSFLYLIDFLLKNKDKIVACELLNKDKTIQPQGGDKLSLLSLFVVMFFLDDIPILGKFLPSYQHTGLNIKKYLKDKAQFVKKYWVSGTALVIPKKVFEKIGFLDENIFMYAEDLDFCIRAFRKNITVGILKTCKIVHLGSKSSSSKFAIENELKNIAYLFKKHFTSFHFFVAKCIILLGILLRVFIFTFFDKKKQKIYLSILKDFLSYEKSKTK